MFEQSSVTMMRVLLTGFEPFGDNTENVSSKILDAIDAELILTDPWASLRGCLLYTSPSPRDGLLSRMPSSA